MSKDDLTEFFASIQNAFLAGDLKKLVTRFASPLVVYSVGGVVVFPTHDDVIERMIKYREALLALTTVTGEFELVSEDPLINNRLRVTVKSHYLGPDRELVSSSLSRYFLVRKDQEFTVEMIEYLEVGFSTDEIERLMH